MSCQQTLPEGAVDQVVSNDVPRRDADMATDHQMIERDELRDVKNPLGDVSFKVIKLESKAPVFKPRECESTTFKSLVDCMPRASRQLCKKRLDVAEDRLRERRRLDAIPRNMAARIAECASHNLRSYARDLFAEQGVSYKSGLNPALSGHNSVLWGADTVEGVLRAYMNLMKQTNQRPRSIDACLLGEVVVCASQNVSSHDPSGARFMAHAARIILETHGEDRVLSIVVHRDQGRLHLHALIVPLAEEGSKHFNAYAIFPPSAYVSSMRAKIMHGAFARFGVITAHDQHCPERLARLSAVLIAAGARVDPERGPMVGSLAKQYWPQFLHEFRSFAQIMTMEVRGQRDPVKAATMTTSSLITVHMGAGERACVLVQMVRKLGGSGVGMGREVQTFYTRLSDAHSSKTAHGVCANRVKRIGVKLLLHDCCRRHIGWAWRAPGHQASAGGVCRGCLSVITKMMCESRWRSKDFRLMSGAIYWLQLILLNWSLSP
jgi:hypothetical protein